MNNLRFFKDVLKVNAIQLLNDVMHLFTPIPKAACRCGKPVVFPNGKRRFICSRCGTAWELVVTVRKVKRTDWIQMVAEVNKLISRLQKNPASSNSAINAAPKAFSTRTEKAISSSKELQLN